MVDQKTHGLNIGSNAGTLRGRRLVFDKKDAKTCFGKK